jgi:hypothetical protein
MSEGSDGVQNAGQRRAGERGAVHPDLVLYERGGELLRGHDRPDERQAGGPGDRLTRSQQHRGDQQHRQRDPAQDEPGRHDPRDQGAPGLRRDHDRAPVALVGQLARGQPSHQHADGLQRGKQARPAGRAGQSEDRQRVGDISHCEPEA